MMSRHLKRSITHKALNGAVSNYSPSLIRRYSISRLDLRIYHFSLGKSC